MPEYDVVVRWEVGAGRAELAALELWDHGATAVEMQGEATLVAAFPTVAAAETVAARVGATTERVGRDWQDAWKAHAQVVEVGGSLVVAPAWRSVPVAGDRLVLEIDPGPCFGSGSHPSTRLLLELLAAAPPAGLAVVDIGTGSGILAVAAARLGAASVTAIDVDPDAVAVTGRNAARNAVASRVHASTTPVTDVGGPFDLALVNVTAGVHAEVGKSAVATVRPGGRVLVAGLLPGQWEHVAGAYTGAHLVEPRHLDGWEGAELLARPGAPEPRPPPHGGDPNPAGGRGR